MRPARKGDGTGLSFPGYSEVRTGDGDVVWSAGDLHAHFDATALSMSDQDSVTTWPDESGNGNDLTAGDAPTYIADGINGNPVVDFNGSTNYLDVDFTSLPQPNTIAIVYRLNSRPGATQTIYSGAVSQEWHIFNDTQDDYQFIAGESLFGSNPNTDAHIGVHNWNTTTSDMREDGVSIVSGDAGTADLNGYTIGSQVDGEDYAEVSVGEILIYPQDKSDIQSDIESYLSDKWGITN